MTRDSDRWVWTANGFLFTGLVVVVGGAHVQNNGLVAVGVALCAVGTGMAARALWLLVHYR